MGRKPGGVEVGRGDVQRKKWGAGTPTRPVHTTGLHKPGQGSSVLQIDPGK